MIENGIKISDPNIENIFKKFEIVIADNGSTDKTPDIGRNLAKKYKKIKYLRLEKRGRGRALKTAWTISKADIFCYMDADLDTDLKHLEQLIKLVEEGYDITYGSRLSKESKVERSAKRNLLSIGYNFLFRIAFNTKIADPQCGFKAVNKTIVKKIVPLVKEKGGPFDAELLLISERLGYKLKEVPVKWADTRLLDGEKSRFNLFEETKKHITLIWRLRKNIKTIKN